MPSKMLGTLLGSGMTHRFARVDSPRALEAAMRGGRLGAS